MLGKQAKWTFMEQIKNFKVLQALTFKEFSLPEAFRDHLKSICTVFPLKNFPMNQIPSKLSQCL